ncbi:hypothetical protein FRY98_24465 [Paenibacillus faecis]|uniref:Uncharacterized protein n=1 Tax=Paenibacillus faecis TaxID=862114 RepID=A0A5D0CLV0_9BACL|nr:hypothetical protein [Paenibacillus faecis]TYA10926.1 hypothetical protein FRY98_24465 [Paenibacillus faecis]
MTPSLMMDKLQEYLQEITSEMFLGPLRLRPNIYKVDLPPRATPDYDPSLPVVDITASTADTTIKDERDERWPFIIIVYTESEDNDEGYRSATVDFQFGCEGRGADGYMDVLHLMEHVRASFLRATWKGWSFRLTRPLSMGFYEEQADPYWMGYMSTTWEVPGFEMEVWNHGY